MASYVRGATIVISTTFTDAAGAPTVPTSAEVNLRFNSAEDGSTQQVSADMTDTNNVWSYAWDSSVARKGSVYYSVKGSSVGNNIVQDGEFDLTANSANEVS